MTVESSNVYFVGGHLDITKDQFNQHYVPRLASAIEEGARFVVGDARGTDVMTQIYLWQHLQDHNRVMVYHIGNSPRHILFRQRCGNFRSDTDRDKAMTANSTRDIAWVRPEEETKRLYGKRYRSGRISGTQKNLDRRIRQNSETC